MATQYGSGVGTAVSGGAIAPGTGIAGTLTETLLSLDQFAHILGIPPMHFAQGVSLQYPDDGGCQSVWFQYDWQSPGKASREAMARAIAQAESMIAHLTGFWPAPKWLCEEMQPYPRQKLHSGPVGTLYYPGMTSGYRKVHTNRWSHFIAGGRRRVDLIAEAATISFPADLDNDFAIITVPWAGATASQASEVAVFPYDDTSPSQQIRDLIVTIDAEVITIKGRAPRFFNPILWEDGDAIDGDDLASYLTAVNVYRVYNSDAGEDYAPVEFGWQTVNDVALTTAYGTIQPRDTKAGMVTPIPAVWDEETSLWSARTFAAGAEPHVMNLYYRAGWPLDALGRVSEPFARAIAALAVSLVVEPICGCANAEKMSGWWQSAPAAREAVSYGQLDCPWGVKRGAYESYKLLSAFWGGAGGIAL